MIQAFNTTGNKYLQIGEYHFAHSSGPKLHSPMPVSYQLCPRPFCFKRTATIVIYTIPANLIQFIRNRHNLKSCLNHTAPKVIILCPRIVSLRQSFRNPSNTFSSSIYTFSQASAFLLCQTSNNAFSSVSYLSLTVISKLFFCADSDKALPASVRRESV